MYYHVLIIKKDNEKIGEFDVKDLKEIETGILIPHLMDNEYFVNGHFINPSEVKRILVNESSKNSEYYIGDALSKQPIGDNSEIYPEDCVFVNDRFSKDITDEIIEKLKPEINGLKDKNAIEILWKRINLEQKKARAEGVADTIAAIIIWFICILLLVGVYYFTNWCYQNWTQVNSNAQSFAVVAGFDLMVLGFVFYLVRREWFSEVRVHNLFEKKIRSLYYKKNNFELKEYEIVCEKSENLSQIKFLNRKNEEQK